jgi:hypothetical protein
MADISIGGAVGEGFSVIRRHPTAVVLWGLVQIALAITTIALLAPFYMTLFEAGVHQGGPPDMASFMPQMQRVQSLSYLVNLLSVFTSSVVYCAVFRSVLHPERNQFGFLRVGAPELFMVLLIIGGYIALVIGMIVAIIPIAIVIGFLVAMHQTAAAVIVGVIAAVVLIIALFYLLLRFSLIGPMMVDDGKFHLGESWTLTRGKVGSLFVIGLLLLLIFLLAEIVLMAVLITVGFIGLSAAAGGLNHLDVFFQQPPQAMLSKLAPLLVIFAVLWVPLGGCAMAIMGAPWARAYRDLTHGDVAATFA